MGPDAPWPMAFHPGPPLMGPPPGAGTGWQMPTVGPGKAWPTDPWAHGPAGPPPARSGRVLGWILLGLVAFLLMVLAVS